MCFATVPSSGYWHFRSDAKNSIHTYDNSGGNAYDNGWFAIGYQGNSSKVRLHAINITTRNLTIGGDTSLGGSNDLKYDMTGSLIIDDLNDNGSEVWGTPNITASTCDFYKGSLYATNANLTCSGSMQLCNFVLDKTGGDWTVNGDLKIGMSSGTVSLTQKSGNFTVSSGKWTRFESGSTCTLNLHGGTFTTQHIRDNTSDKSPKVVFNGGTLKANNANSNGLIGSGVVVNVGANGGTINANGKSVSIKVPILEDSGSTGGGMAFIGGGTVTLVGGNTYTGATTVEVGTTLVVPAAIAGGDKLAFTIPASGLADGVYTVVCISGDSQFADGVLTGAALPVDANAQFRLSRDMKSILCIYGNPGFDWIGGASGSLSDSANWANGSVPGASDNCTIASATPAALTLGNTFAPASVTFAAGSNAVTIDGERTLSGIVAVTNLSSTSHTINAKVYFTGDIQVKQAAMAEVDDLAKAHVTFAGGAYAADGCSLESGDYIATYSRCIFGKYYLATTSSSRWNAQYGGIGKRVCMADRSYLYIPYAGNLTVLYIGNGAKVDVGDIAADGGRIGYKNYGEMVVTNMTLTGSGNRYVSYQQGTETPGVFKFETVTNAMTGNWFYFSDSSKAASHVFYIGAGGLNFSGSGSAYAFGNFENNAETIRPWYSDFTIANRGDGMNTLILNRNVEFCTDDESGTGRTITIDGITKGDGTSPAITVSGSGTLKVNKAANNVAQPTVTVKDTATLAIKPGASLGTGATTINSGAALAVAESGTVALGGNLTLKDGATLKFNFTDRHNAPQLAVSGALSVPSTLDIEISGLQPSRGEYYLTTGEKFSGVTAVNFVNKPEWALASIEDGNVKLKVFSGLFLLFK